MTTHVFADAEVTIWGLGLIGYSLAGELARAGTSTVVVDIDPERVRRLNDHQPPFTHVPDIPERYLSQVGEGRLRAVTDPAETLDARHHVHIVCVQTERNGVIDDGPLLAVTGTIAASGPRETPLYLIIESTIASTWIDTIHELFARHGWRHGLDYHLGASPRRDWLISGGHTMASTPKIIGGDSEPVVNLMRDLYGRVCGELLVARDAKHAALVKVVENYLRYRDIVVVNELVTALPDFDMADTLRLAGSKWNIETYHPSLGVGGYCVPLAKDYLAASAADRRFFDGLSEHEDVLFGLIRESLLRHDQFGPVMVLGVAYAADMKISIRSPGLAVIELLQRNGREVRVHDPLYTDDELLDLTGAKPVAFPDGLSSCTTVVLITGHRRYLDLDDAELGEVLRGVATVVDNTGAWRGRSMPAGTRYLQVGGGGYHVPSGGERP